jgi:hypothetical protein
MPSDKIFKKACGKYYCIYLDRSKFSHQFSIICFVRQIIDAILLRRLYFHGSASILYKLPYCPLFFSIVLDSILFGSNKGYHLCSPLPSFPHLLHIPTSGSKAHTSNLTIMPHFVFGKKLY